MHARLIGAVAGLVPAAIVAGLFALGGTAAPPLEVARSLVLVAFIALTAGGLAGPLAAPGRRLTVAACGYAICVLAVNGVLAVAQGTWDAWTARGPDPAALIGAIAWRGLVALAGTAYLLLPAIALGLAWAATARAVHRAWSWQRPTANA